MSEQEKDNRRNDTGEDRSRSNGTESEYRFMDQRIKKRPVERRHILVRVLGVVIAGVAVGLIASLVLSLTQPALRQKFMPVPEETMSVEADSGMEEAESEVTGEPEDTTSSEETASGEEAPETEEESETAEEIGRAHV